MTATSFVVAIDGPAAAGKGTLSRRIALAYRLAHLDTGALYRATGRDALDAGIDVADSTAVAAAAAHLDPASLGDPRLRDERIGHMASIVAALGPVRAALLEYQRQFARNPPGWMEGKVAGAVLDGRDVGTVVCPDAPVKLYVTASVEARSRRRVLELLSRGETADPELILADLRSRDARDSGRADAPLRPADDAVILDTSTLDAEQAYAAAAAIIDRALQG